MSAAIPYENFEQLIHHIDPHYRLVRSWPLTGGASAQMTALEIALPDGGTKIVVLRQPGDTTLKLNPHAAADEFRLLQTLNAAGLPTPKPYLVDESRELLSTPFLVIAYIEGESVYAPTNLADFVSQAAAALAQIHGLDCTQLDLTFLPTQTRSIAKKFGDRYAHSDTAPIEGRIWEALKSVDTIPGSNPSALVHGDFWPGNLLWREGRLIAVIDWEDAVLGDPLSDFAISRLDTLMIFGQQALHEFTRYYQSAIPELDFTYLPYWDLCAALRAAPNLADWAAGFSSLGRPDITEQTMRESHGLFTKQALEKLAVI